MTLEKSAESLYKGLTDTDIRLRGDDFTFEYWFEIRLNAFDVWIITPLDYTAYMYSENKEDFQKAVCCDAICRYLYDIKGKTV